MKIDKIIFLLVSLLFSVNANAIIQVEIDGIYYTINEEEKIAKVETEVSVLPDVVIPETITYDGVSYSVTEIGKMAFLQSNIVSVTIPNSVTSIGDAAFFWCENLTTVTIGTNVKSIGMDAFDLSYRLTSVNISDIEAWCNIEFANNSSNPLRYARHLFLNDNEINDLIIPSNVRNIGNYAFYCCNSLTSVIIPNSVTSIGELAFYSCENLASVTIPESVTIIKDAAFSYCQNINKVEISDLTAWCNIDFATMSSNPIYKCHLYVNNAEVSNLVIPNNVTAIKDYCFYGCSGLISVEIPNSVKSIGEYAFAWSSITSVSIPNSVQSIGNHAFERCFLKSVDIPESVTTLGDSVFYYCGEMTSANINSQGSIGNNAFASCKSLNTIDIGKGITTIEKGAFNNCNITSLKIGENVTTIGRTAFSSCKNLKYLEIGTNVIKIDVGAFQFCKNLTSIIIPRSVTYIGNEVFYESTNIVDVYCEAEQLTTEENGPGMYADVEAFGANNNYESITLHVPENAIELYKNTEPWRKFRIIVALTDDDPKPTGIKSLKEDSYSYPVATYSIDGKRLQKAQRGLNIIRMNDGKTIKRYQK